MSRLNLNGSEKSSEGTVKDWPVEVTFSEGKAAINNDVTPREGISNEMFLNVQ